MDMKSLSREELETMTYGEISEVILSEKGSKMKIVDIFKKICKLLELSDQEFESKIADFFELISTDKTFIVLDKGYCDLRKKHTPTVVIEDDEDDEPELELDDDETVITDETIESEDDIFYDKVSDDDDSPDDSDELSDFIVVDDEDETSM